MVQVAILILLVVIVISPNALAGVVIRTALVAGVVVATAADLNLNLRKGRAGKHGSDNESDHDPKNVGVHLKCLPCWDEVEVREKVFIRTKMFCDTVICPVAYS